jgi:transposase
MATRYADEFHRDAVRIATTSGLTRAKSLSDSGGGLSTMNKRVQCNQPDASGVDLKTQTLPPSVSLTTR